MKKADWFLIAAGLAVLVCQYGPTLIKKFDEAVMADAAGDKRPALVMAEKPPPVDGAFKISSP